MYCIHMPQPSGPSSGAIVGYFIASNAPIILHNWSEITFDTPIKVQIIEQGNRLASVRLIDPPDPNLKNEIVTE